tara:strand:+ start:166698 stop:167672 length:975 start_codon:yes stop_codon:yes gene_type:complete
MERVIEGSRRNITKQVKSSMGYLGANFNFGQKNLGVEQASKYIRGYNFGSFLSYFFDDPQDFGDIDQVGAGLHELNPKLILSNMRRLYRACLKVIDESERAMFIGGDHSIGMATVAAVKHRRPDTLVVWVDAHADINTPSQSATKSFHGMPVSFLTGLVDEPKYAGFSDFNGCLNHRDIIYLGVRDLDPAEEVNLAQLGIEVISQKDIDQFGVSELLSRSLQRLDPYGDRPIHLSFDLDAVDPNWAPCTGVPVESGLSLDQLNHLSWTLHKTHRVKSMDFVELNPKLANSEKEINKSIQVLYHLIGGLFPYKEQYEMMQRSLLN